MSALTYDALIDAIQTHIRDTHGDNQYARDWVLICGVEAATMSEVEEASIQVIKSPRAAIYTVTGWLGWASDICAGYGDDYDDDE